jgi:aryl carrier-like protein
MVPSTYVSLASLPVTTTGKCDKRALPPPTPANVLPELREFAAASAENHNDTEARIAQMVSALMGGRPIHRDDNFFLVGGHSMLAAQLLARVRESMSITLSLRQLFEAPTIAALAAAVDRKLAAK